MRTSYDRTRRGKGRKTRHKRKDRSPGGDDRSLLPKQRRPSDVGQLILPRQHRPSGVGRIVAIVPAPVPGLHGLIASAHVVCGLLGRRANGRSGRGRSDALERTDWQVRLACQTRRDLFPGWQVLHDRPSKSYRTSVTAWTAGVLSLDENGCLLLLLSGNTILEASAMEELGSSRRVPVSWIGQLVAGVVDNCSIAVDLTRIEKQT